MQQAVNLNLETNEDEKNRDKPITPSDIRDVHFWDKCCSAFLKPCSFKSSETDFCFSLSYCSLQFVCWQEDATSLDRGRLGVSWVLGHAPLKRSGFCGLGKAWLEYLSHFLTLTCIMGIVTKAQECSKSPHLGTIPFDNLCPKISIFYGIFLKMPWYLPRLNINLS